MNILYKLKLTQVMGSTMGGDTVGKVKGQMDSKGSQPALKFGSSWGNLAGTLLKTRGGVCRL
jgi:hypothetical protein